MLYAEKMIDKSLSKKLMLEYAEKWLYGEVIPAAIKGSYVLPSNVTCDQIGDVVQLLQDELKRIQESNDDDINVCEHNKKKNNDDNQDDEVETKLKNIIPMMKAFII